MITGRSQLRPSKEGPRTARYPAPASRPRKLRSNPGTRGAGRGAGGGRTLSGKRLSTPQGSSDTRQCSSTRTARPDRSSSVGALKNAVASPLVGCAGSPGMAFSALSSKGVEQEQRDSDEPHTRIHQPTGHPNRTQYTGGRCSEIVSQLSPWFSLTHSDPVVVPNASRSPVSSTSSAWR